MKIFYIFVLKFLFFIQFSEQSTFAKCSKNDVRPVELVTTSGTLVGSCDFVNVNDNGRESKSRNVYSWLSVPYAEPPVGQFRFKGPVEYRRREEKLDCTKLPNSCMQHIADYESQEDSFQGFSMWAVDQKVSKLSEDCLYLNIYVPDDAYLRNSYPGASSEFYPILVFFHGGATTTGSSGLDVYNPSTLVAATNTIVITVNYRLGVFGFLYLDNEFPGNQGLLDQNEALRWIKNNADKFGGDANRITIAGFSSGAILTGYHLFYRDSWQYFRNIVLQSGTPLYEPLTPITTEEANRNTREFLTDLGCGTETSTEADLASCAQNSENLAQASLSFFEKTSHNQYAQIYLLSQFIPVLDGRVFTETPLDALRSGNFKKCPVITGFTADEGSMFVAYSNLFGTTVNDIRKQQNINHTQFLNFLNNFLYYYPKYPVLRNDLLINAISHEYTKIINEVNEDGIQTPLIKPSYFHSLKQLIGDLMFKCPAYKFSDLLVKNGATVYLYFFAHRLSSTPWPSWYGATHGDDLAFTFAHVLSSRDPDSIVGVNPWANPKHKYSTNEKNLNNEILTYWSNFVWHNTPNTESNQKIWPEYSLFNIDYENGNMTDPSESGRYIIFKTNGTRINRGYSLEICQFWNSYLPSLLKENSKQVESARSQSQPEPVMCELPTTTSLPKSSQSSVVEQQQVQQNFASRLNKHLHLNVLLIFLTLFYCFLI